MATAETKHEGLRSLFDEHYVHLVRLAALMVDDTGTAEEVVQEAFVSVQRRWDRLDPERAGAYLRSAVCNGARSALRHRGTVRRFLARQSEARQPDPHPPAETAGVASATRGEVLEAIRRLPDTQRNVVLLRYFLDCSEAEIAAALGVSPGTVKTSAHRALAKLAPALEALR
ncbi:MAG: RNA polymerase sigma factor [Acidimicrobiia bacterium]